MFIILRYSLSCRPRLPHSVHAGGCFLCTAWCLVPFGARWGALFVHGWVVRPLRCTLRGRFCARHGGTALSVHAGRCFLCTAWRFGRSVHAGRCFLCTPRQSVPFGAHRGVLFVHGMVLRPFWCTLGGAFCARRGCSAGSVHAGRGFAWEIKKCDIYNLDHVII